MRRFITDLSTEQVQGLLDMYLSRVPDGRTSPETELARQRQFDADLQHRRIALGLSEADASELSVLLEHNRRNLWCTASSRAMLNTSPDQARASVAS